MDAMSWLNSLTEQGSSKPYVGGEGEDRMTTATAFADPEYVLYGGIGKGNVDPILDEIAKAAGLPSDFDWKPYLAEAAQQHFQNYNQVYVKGATNYSYPVTAAVALAAGDNPALAPFAAYTAGPEFQQQGMAQMEAAAERKRAGHTRTNMIWVAALTAGIGGAALGGSAVAGEGAATGATGGALTGESAALASNIGGASGMGLTAAEGAALGTGAASVAGAGAAPAAAGGGTTTGGPGESFISGTGGDVTVGALPAGTSQGMGTALPALTGTAAGPAAGALQPSATTPPPATSPPGALQTAATNAGTSAAVNSALSPSEKAAMVESGTTGTAGAAMEADALGTGSTDQYLASLPPATQGLLGQLGLGDASAALGKLMKLGLPIATIAGLFEKPNNPLLGPIVQAAQKAIGQADQFAALGPIGLTPAQEQAIALAKENVGSYKPYLERSGALADTAAGGIQQSEIDRYMNPYLDSVLAPGIRDIEQAAARRREQLRAVTSMSGNDLRTPSTDPNRFNVEDNLLDKSTLQSIGDLSAKTRASGYDTATGLAGKDLDRSLSSSNIYGGLGKAEGALGATDVASLTGAGALERLPQEDARQKAADAAKLYTGVAGQTGALNAAAQPSTLTNVTGALGTLKAAKDVGLY